MAGKRIFKKVQIDRSEGDNVVKTIELAEGGASGQFSVWNRRVAGTAVANIQTYGSFVSDPTEDERMLLSWGGYTANDYLDTDMWGWWIDFPYLTFVVDFSNSVEPDPEAEEEPAPESGTIELYVVSF